MPYLHNATTEPGFHVIWKSHPEHNRPSTYQSRNRALQFLRSLEYDIPEEGDKIEIPNNLCRPLRILGDLHFKDEQSPGTVELDHIPNISGGYGIELSEDEEAKLREYIETHPRLTKERETELSEDLEQLNSDTDITLELNGKKQEKTGEGPAGSVNIDVSEYFGDHILPPEIEEIIRGNEPFYVGDDVPEKVKNSENHISVEEYYSNLNSVNGFEKSILELHNHTKDISSIKVEKGVIKYHIESIEHTQQGNWFINVLDGRYTDDCIDLRFEFTMLPKNSIFIKHKVSIDQKHIVKWSVHAEKQVITESSSRTEEVSSAEFHQTLHDRCWLLQTIENFIGGLDNYSIEKAADWHELGQ